MDGARREVVGRGACCAQAKRGARCVQTAKHKQCGTARSAAALRRRRHRHRASRDGNGNGDRTGRGGGGRGGRRRRAAAGGGALSVKVLGDGRELRGIEVELGEAKALDELITLEAPAAVRVADAEVARQPGHALGAAGLERAPHARDNRCNVMGGVVGELAGGQPGEWRSLGRRGRSRHRQLLRRAPRRRRRVRGAVGLVAHVVVVAADTARAAGGVDVKDARAHLLLRIARRVARSAHRTRGRLHRAHR